MSTNKDVFIHALKIQGSVKDSPGSNERIKPEGLLQSSPQTQSIIYSSFSIQRGESAIYFLSVYFYVFAASAWRGMTRWSAK